MRKGDISPPKDISPAVEFRSCLPGARSRGRTRRRTVGAGHRRGVRPEGDQVGAAGLSRACRGAVTFAEPPPAPGLCFPGPAVNAAAVQGPGDSAGRDRPRRPRRTGWLPPLPDSQLTEVSAPREWPPVSSDSVLSPSPFVCIQSRLRQFGVAGRPLIPTLVGPCISGVPASHETGI